MLPVFRDSPELWVNDTLVLKDKTRLLLAAVNEMRNLTVINLATGNEQYHPEPAKRGAVRLAGANVVKTESVEFLTGIPRGEWSHIERAGQRIELGGAETNVRVGSFVEHVGYGLFLVTWTPNELETRAVGHQMGYSINGGVACGHHYNTTDYLPADIVRKLLGDPSTKRVLEPHEVAEHFAAQAGGRFVRGDGVKWYSSSNNDNYIYKAFPDRHIAYRKDGSDLYGYTFEKPLSLASCTEIPAPSWASAVNGEVTHA